MVVLSDRAPRLQSALKEYKLALNRAHHNAGNEVPLQQGIDQQQRDNCNNDLGCIEVGVAQGGRIHHGRQIALLDMWRPQGGREAARTYSSAK